MTSKAVDKETLSKIREQKRKADEAWRIAKRLSGDGGYSAHKDEMTRRSRAESRQGRDIGAIPPCVDPDRRAEGSASFRRFCEIYLSARFTLDWSPDHLTTLGRVEHSLLHGGLFALAMPRGSGKTTIAESAALWATMTGRRRYVLVIGATASAAQQILRSIKTELETNELLNDDFPDITAPIRAIEGVAQRGAAQLCQGRQTRIVWGAQHLIFADIPGCDASQAIIQVAGLTGNIRGRKHKMADGRTVRPDFVILDDPQTDKSARSERDTEQRKRIVSGAILGLAGPGQTISGVMPCTVIRRGDLADSMLDRKQHPHWHGERFKMLYSLPANARLWDQYAEALTAELANGGDGTRATQFYIAHQSDMDDGARAAWPARKLPTEASAIQHAMNLRIRNAAAFDAEYQNEPRDTAAEADLLTADQITRKQAVTVRGVCSIGVQHVTAFIDVQDDALFWLACGWTDGFSGTIIDYGVFPQIIRTQFRLEDLSGLLTRTYPGLGQEARWHRAIVELANKLSRKEWLREDGTTINAGKVLVDSAYGKSTDTVYEAVRTCGLAAVQCSRGKYYGAASQPMSDLALKPGRRLGVHWFEDRVDGRQTRCVTIDTNWWKSFVHARLSTPLGDNGSLTLYRAEPYQHATLAEHLTAEFRTRTFGRGREVDEWKIKPDRPDNHWFDCLVGCAVGASMLGVGVDGGKRSPAGRQPTSFAEMQRIARERRQ